MTSFLTKYKTIIALIIFGLLTLYIYNTGKSHGEANGYKTGKAEAEAVMQVDLDNAIRQYNELRTTYDTYVKESALKAYALEQESIALRNQLNKELIAYQNKLAKIELSAENAKTKAWTKETSIAINQVLASLERGDYAAK